MVNEGRFGMSRQGTNVLHATDVPGQEKLLDLLPKTTGGLPLLTQYCTPSGFFTPAAMSWCGENGGLVGARGNGPSATDTFDSSPRWTVADTLTWTLGQHSFKVGGTYIKATSKTEVKGSDISNHALPVAQIGAAPLAPSNAFSPFVAGGFRALNPTLDPGLVTNNSTRMNDLLVFLNGSLSQVSQGRFINSPKQVGTAWNDPVKGDLVQVRDLQQHEINFFFKDDWKVTQKLTLNLGFRWDYYGVPYDKNGMTMTIDGGSDALFGRSGTGFKDWLLPGERGKDVNFRFVGPNSPNAGESVYKRDLNNFGPAVGFSYSVPWLGRDKTVVRGGYQLTTLGGGQADVIGPIIQSPPGSATIGTFTGPSGGQYFNIKDVVGGLGVPVEPSFLPVKPVPVYDRSTTLTVFDTNYVSPYVQNLTLSVTRTINSKFSLDVKYIATLSRKLPNTFNLNVPDVFQNGLFQAFEAARAGGESTLLNNIFNGIDMRTSPFAPPAIVGQNGLTGAGFVRSDSRFNADLANGNYTVMATNLATLNYVSSLNPGLPPIPPGTNNGNVLRVNKFPENFIFTSPQFNSGGVFGGGANLRTNMLHRNYHSMQTQFTVRPVYGLSNSFTYTWAKNLGDTGTFTVPWDRSRDYRLSGNAHSFRSYGTFDLPIGPNKLFLAGSSGPLARAVEGWQLSWIYNLASGAPLQVASQRSGWYNNNEAILVDPTKFDAKDGKVTWAQGAKTGSYFSGYTQAKDPQCTNSAAVATSLQALCTLNALYDASGALVFRTPRPGEFSNYRDHVFAPWNWTVDMAMSKKVQLSERTSLNLRMDATNVFNHPTVANPNLSIQGGGSTFGTITTKNGVGVQFSNYGRVFQAQARLSF